MHTTLLLGRATYHASYFPIHTSPSYRLYIFGTQFPFEPPGARARRQQVEGGSAGGDDAKSGSVEGTVEDEEPIVPVLYPPHITSPVSGIPL
jgi:hypothetical protein